MENKLLQIGIKMVLFVSVLWIVLMTTLVFFQGISPWIMTPIVLIGIIVLPGFLLSINLKIKTKDILDRVIYSVGLGLFSVLAGGLLINWILPYVGVKQPLAVLPLVIFFDLLVLALLAGLHFFNKNYEIQYQIILPNKTNLFFGIFPLVFVICSVLGAIRLNNGAGGTLTLLMLFGIALYAIALVYFERLLNSWVYASALYTISLSLLLMYSLRSGHILGWDINQEYQVFQMTLKHLVWKTSYYPGGDYNACVSITILPTILKQLTHISSEHVFKITTQLLFAALPVMIYSLAKRYSQKLFAFLAAFLFLAQTWFFEQMPALIRQEIALLFYGLIILSIFDAQLEKSKRFLLFYIFTSGLILSHYSTAYVWFTLLFGALAISFIAPYFLKHLKNRSVNLKPLLFIIPLILLAIWQINVTGSGYALKKFIAQEDIEIPITENIEGNTENVVKSVQVLEIKTNSVESKKDSGFIKNIFNQIFFVGNNLNSDDSLRAAEEKAATRHIESRQEIYPDVLSVEYTLKTIDNRYYTESKVPKFLTTLLTGTIRISKLLLINFFPIIGIVGLYFTLRRLKSEESYDFIILNIAAYCFIVLMVFLPWFQQYYNFTRLYLQMFVTLSVFAVIGGLFATQYFPRQQKLILTSMVIIIFCSLTGVFDQITGGQARITLNQPPAIHDTFYIHDAEIASAQWLYLNHGTSRVETDVIANLRLQSFGNFSADYFAIFPRTIEKNAYIYTITPNITQGYGYYLHQNNLLTYNYPLEFLNDHKSIVYSSGKSRIYK